MEIETVGKDNGGTKMLPDWKKCSLIKLENMAYFELLRTAGAKKPRILTEFFLIQSVIKV